MRLRRYIAALLGILLLAAAVAFLTGDSDTLRFRRRLLSLKLRGAIPYVPWSHLLWRMLPARIRLPELYRPPGPITAKQAGAEPCPVLWETPAGAFWGTAGDYQSLALLAAEQVTRNIYQPPEVAIRSDDVVFDVGSHLGTFTRSALDRGARRVVAFEPHPVNIACFKRTFEQEIAAGRVTLVEAALWETPGTLDLRTSLSSLVGSVLPGQPALQVIRVPATTLDQAVLALGLDRVDFIKMDIEGAELYALRGGRDTLRRFTPRMALCIYHSADDAAVIPQLVLAIHPGYRVFTRDAAQAYFY